MLKITISASSQTGMVREHNEDAILVSHRKIRDAEVSTGVFLNRNERYVVAVCDGLGGQNAGEVASMDAVEQLEQRVDTLRSGLPIERVGQLMAEWVNDEHEYLLSTGKDEPSMEGLGTTMVGMLFYEGHICWMNCGDSRLYRLRKGVLRQISRDHSLYNMTHRSADVHVIINCLGGGAPSAFLDFFDVTSEVLEGDVFLLCSDGLTDMLTDDKIEKLLNKDPRAKALTDEAVSSGGLDNVSVCLVTIEGIDQN